MIATKDSSEPPPASSPAASSTAAGSVALLPEPFEVNEKAVSLAAKAARDVLMRMSVGDARRLLRRETPASSPSVSPTVLPPLAPSLADKAAP